MYLTYLELLTRLGLTILFAGLIGAERAKHHKAAGIVTHTLVAVSTCTLAILQVEIYHQSIELIESNVHLVNNVTLENQRIIAQVITGIGFLGGGAILKTKDGVQGLTTAATLWSSGVIGIVFGLGFFEIGIVVSVLTLFIVVGVKYVIRKRRESK